jgi:hypothetical protein
MQELETLIFSFEILNRLCDIRAIAVVDYFQS